MDRTIAAVSTPVGTGGVSIIRISGSHAVEIGDKVFRGAKQLKDCPTHTIHYGHIVGEDGIKIDEVLVSVMRAPRTYTGEDVIEINTHGGIVVTRRVLDQVIRRGAYPAQAGEFTKRAFLNGRIDLSKAEAVIDVINAKNDLAQQNAFNQLDGALSVKINAMRQSLVELAASMQVAIDYPDEDLEEITVEEMAAVLKGAQTSINKLMDTAQSGRLIQDGIKTVIVGKPNVGKSSLLNQLAGEERAIVTDVAGTTRDVIEEYVNIAGVPLRLIDTAGIRETEDAVEKIGVEKSKQSIDGAELVLVIMDAAKELEEEDSAVLEKTKQKNRVVLINKTDIADDAVVQQIKDAAGETCFCISAKNGEGIEALAAEIKKRYQLGSVERSDEALVTNTRHQAALIHAGEAVKNALNTLESGMPQDLAALDINMAIDSLGEITGATVSDDIVTSIFHSFCVGK